MTCVMEGTLCGNEYSGTLFQRYITVALLKKITNIERQYWSLMQ